ncbi:LLM class flavin-dependent oxidoreductase [Actinoplanes siamensis]|uniref:Monooxygenase n=1 Tax=Actinoplanes siamensis TaxID=1223317 RepID=A0A919TMB0_9ACTN|nr:LLM class flavin-dependent oxidoreductase [Actinoplanes siamensis]GIF07088.1 monooxygenase [Actinoplanes siamensis]
MDIGIGLPTTVSGADGRALVAFALRAEAAGFSTLACFDRLVYDNYDSLIALAAAAGATERIRLATTVLLAPYRPSVAELAKQLASLDRLSGGRLVLGVSAGGRADDFAAAGTTYGDRGRRLDRMIEEMREIWAGRGPFPGIGPRPTGGDVPVWIGGHSPAALRRAARHGAGWISPGGSAAGFPQLVEHARAVFTAQGRTEAPYLVALANVALGEQRRAEAERHVLRYYQHLGPKARFLVDSLITDGPGLRAAVDGFAKAGCDELLLFPCTGDPQHVDDLAAELHR